MLVIIVEVIMFIIGLSVVLKGKYAYERENKKDITSNKKYVEGSEARICGAIYAMALPLTILLNIVWYAVYGDSGNATDNFILSCIDAIIIIICTLVPRQLAKRYAKKYNIYLS